MNPMVLTVVIIEHNYNILNYTADVALDILFWEKVKIINYSSLVTADLCFSSSLSNLQTPTFGIVRKLLLHCSGITMGGGGAHGETPPAEVCASGVPPFRFLKK